MDGSVVVEIAKELAKRGYVEVVNRAKDGKILEILKYGIEDFNILNPEGLAGLLLKNGPTMLVSAIGDIASTGYLKHVIDGVGDKVDLVNAGISVLQGTVNGIDSKVDIIVNGIQGVDRKLFAIDKKLLGLNQNIGAVSDQVKLMAKNIEILQSSLGVVATMDVMIIGLVAANLVMTATGFAKINRKLNSIEDSISMMQESLRRIAKKQELDIVKEFKEVRENYADMLDAAKRHTPFNERQYYSLTVKLNSMLDYLYTCFMSDAVENKTVILEAIYVLLPMFANVLAKYDTEYYFDYKDEIVSGSVWHNQHDIWMKTFERLMDRSYLDKYQDYCFLDEGVSSREADASVLTAYLVAVNAATIVDDNQKILLCFESEDRYREFKGEIVKEADKDIQSILKEYDEETVKLLNPGFKKAVQELTASSY